MNFLDWGGIVSKERHHNKQLTIALKSLSVIEETLSSKNEDKHSKELLQTMFTGLNDNLATLLPHTKDNADLAFKANFYMSRAERVKDLLEAAEKSDKISKIPKNKPKLNNKPSRKSPTPAFSKPTAVGSKMEEAIMSEMLQTPPKLTFAEIAGVEEAKTALRDAIILPALRPDIFVGLRAPPKGILLYGPPGTGKTLLARATASECGHSFFSVGGASLTSKWHGEGEKLVQALFKVARDIAPSVIFMDEVDSLLSARKSDGGEHEASRRLKTTFMTEIDGVLSPDDDPTRTVIVLANTNLPFDLDDAVLRRLSKRVYVGLPDAKTRAALIKLSLKSNANTLSLAQINRIANDTKNYSCADIAILCKDAAMKSFKDLDTRSILNNNSIPPISYNDFVDALKTLQPTVSNELLLRYEQFNKKK